jgi:hypothetical protein
MMTGLTRHRRWLAWTIVVADVGTAEATAWVTDGDAARGYDGVIETVAPELVTTRDCEMDNPSRQSDS